MSDLLDHTDLNTYCLNRTVLNVHIALNADETVLDPLAPKMVSAGDQEDNGTPFDIILEHFNERHFQGWEATPEEQRTKVIKIAQLVTQASQYRNTVVENPETEAAERIFMDILRGTMSHQRNSDLSLYRMFQQDESFRHDFANLGRSAIENADLVSNVRFTRQ